MNAWLFLIAYSALRPLRGTSQGGHAVLGGALWSGLPPVLYLSLPASPGWTCACVSLASFLLGHLFHSFLNLLLFTWWLAAMGPSFAVVNSVNRRMHAGISD